MMLKQWEKILREKMEENGEAGEAIDYSVTSCPQKLIAWTKNTVYYSGHYNGDAYISSVPRNPSKGE